MGAGAVRAIIVGALISCVTGGYTQAQTPRAPIGDYGSPPDAMIFYVAHGAAGSCGQGCADWIAAEGTVQWDTHKRLFAILDRQPPGRRLPVVIHAWGSANLNVAPSLGRILRERGIDTTEGVTEVDACKDKSEADCFALKRPGGPLDARISRSDARCDLACILILVGGVHRNLPPDTRVIVTGTAIRNRLAPNVSDEARDALTVQSREKLRNYLRDMGVEQGLVDIVDRNSESHGQTELPPSEWARLRIITDVPQ